MTLLVDVIYTLAALFGSPIWLVRMIHTGKIRTDWVGRFGRVPESARPSSSHEAGGNGGFPTRRLLIHAVSVGEINAIRLLVDRLAKEPEPPQLIIASTTDTGFARAEVLFGDRHIVVRYPFDFSFAVKRFLDGVQPDAVALVELEVWPNFTAQCAKRGTPVCVINGRLTIRSARRYARVSALIRPSFKRLVFAAVQNEAYAQRFRQLGVVPENVKVMGTMKWDTAEIADDVPGADELAQSMGIDRTQPLVVAGSTAPDEHELLDQLVPSDVQLLCAPRKPEWFDAAADDLPGCARRSRGDHGSSTNRFLLDTIGELRQAYSLADVVVVGRSFGKLHGSDMMEPVALGKATIVGPSVTDFQDAADALLAGDGIVQTTRENLKTTIHELLEDSIRRKTLAKNGRAVIVAHQGATQLHADLLLSLLCD